MKEKTAWYFPTNLGGQEEGFENQGINQFMMSPCGKLAREIIQNSYDARLKKENNKVQVKFELLNLPKNKIPDLENVEKRIEASAEYFPDNARLKKFKDASKNVFNNDIISVLKISDYNTTGLVGIERKQKSSWYGLIKSSGNSTNKTETSGGSYGSGKHAAFVFSYFRTVLYGTFVKDEGYAFQGKSILCSHMENSELKSNVGFWGIVDGNECKPIRDSNQVDEVFRRTETGTDLYIIGAKLDRDNWDRDILYSVIENFWKLIIEDKLEVTIINGESQVTIDKTNVRGLAQIGKANKVKIDEHDAFNAYKFIELYDDTEAKVVYGSICEENDVELKIAKMLNYPEKKILKMRDTEMKIDIFAPRKRPVNFIGILIAKGKLLNEQLRESEPQTHDAWNADNIEDIDDRKKIKKTIDKMNDWLNEQINSLEYVDNDKQFDADGLDFLSISDYDDPSISDYQSPFEEIENEETPEQQIIVVPKPTPKSALNPDVTNGTTTGGAGGGTEPTPSPTPTPDPDPTPNPFPNPIVGGGKPYHEMPMMYIKTPYDDSKGMYKVIIRAKETIENCTITLQRLTDSGDLERIKIESAKQDDDELITSGNTIKGVRLNENTDSVIFVSLTNKRKCIMEVKVYVQE